MNPELDTLATRLYVTIDALLIDHPEWAPERPAIGIAPKLTDAELVTLAVIQALLGFTSEARFIRHARAHLRPWFPYLPDRPGYNKRLRRSGQLLQHVIAALAWQCPSWNDDLWLVDSTPIECGRSRETTKRSDLAGWATYGYCSSHSRFFWGLRLHLITTPTGLPIAYALAGPDRFDHPYGRIDWASAGRLDFEPPDRAAFPCLDLAFEAGRRGGTAPAMLSAANEVAVDAFLDGRIRWVDIAAITASVMERAEVGPAASFDEVLHGDTEARRYAEEVIGRSTAGR